MTKQTDQPERGVWLAIILIFATLVGVGAGVLSWMAGSKAPAAILVGGAAFGAAVGLGITVWIFLRPGPQ